MPPSSPTRARPSRVLIIDDHPTNIVLAQACLKSENVVCENATNGEEGLRLAIQSPPDLVLLDIMLPGIDGFDVCRQLKAHTRTCNVPVLMITALQDLDHKIQGLQAGAEDFISKPFNRAELQARVRSLLRVKFLQEEQLEAERLRVRYQMSQEIDRLKDAFISVVSHEIRTPLTVMKGYMSLLKSPRYIKTDPEGMIERLVEAMSVSMTELEALLKQLLDLSQLRSGLAEMNKTEVSMPGLLEQVVSRLRPQAEQKGLQLHLGVDESMRPIRVDAGKLEQAFDQLVANAVNFTPMGGRIDVTAQDEGDSVQVIVADTGIGIAAEHLASIFDPFFQVADYLTRKVEGMGVGLAIVKHIVEDHGGSIIARSEVNRGTSFHVHLPRSVQDVREILRGLRDQLQTMQQNPLQHRAEVSGALGSLAGEPDLRLPLAPEPQSER